eukprot:gb/GECG01012171.1/.p1 GENE.gb/GECG01012171.1/~~gb/GECG01012171.1/.p1  ORF type:complete len:467 (+),score=50.05 gb/GECG01012171.1/:1-1401(+)
MDKMLPEADYTLPEAVDRWYLRVSKAFTTSVGSDEWRKRFFAKELNPIIGIPVHSGIDFHVTLWQVSPDYMHRSMAAICEAVYNKEHGTPRHLCGQIKSGDIDVVDALRSTEPALQYTEKTEREALYEHGVLPGTFRSNRSMWLTELRSVGPEIRHSIRMIFSVRPFHEDVLAAVSEHNASYPRNPVLLLQNNRAFGKLSDTYTGLLSDGKDRPAKPQTHTLETLKKWLQAEYPSVYQTPLLFIDDAGVKARTGISGEASMAALRMEGDELVVVLEKTRLVYRCENVEVCDDGVKLSQDGKPLVMICKEDNSRWIMKSLHAAVLCEEVSKQCSDLLDSPEIRTESTAVTSFNVKKLGERWIGNKFPHIVRCYFDVVVWLKAVVEVRFSPEGEEIAVDANLADVSKAYDWTNRHALLRKRREENIGVPEFIRRLKGDDNYEPVISCCDGANAIYTECPYCCGSNRLR